MAAAEKDSIGVLRSGTGSRQADHQIFNQLRKMSSPLLVAERNLVEFSTLFRPDQPVVDDIGNTALQYRAHSFFINPRGRSAGNHLLSDEISESSDIERFYDNFVGFQKYSGHGPLARRDTR
jgi:hypothetical protein